MGDEAAMNSGTGGPEGRATTFGGAAKSALRRLLFATVAIAALGAGAPRAETANGALIKAYLNNPDINTQRAAVRVADENVPKANAGYLPTITGDGQCRPRARRHKSDWRQWNRRRQHNGRLRPRGYGVTANETVFNGIRTINSISQAESQVLGAREQLRNTEQNTLLSGVTAYMDVLRDTAILDLDHNNVQVLQEQLRETRDRFTVGEVTRTDVAQAEASLASAQATALSAVATLQAAVAQLPPGHRRSADEPCAGQADREAAAQDLARGDLDLAGRASRDRGVAPWRRRGASADQDRRGRALPDSRGHRLRSTNNSTSTGSPVCTCWRAQIMGQLTIPIYQGGAEYASTRQAKESLSQQEMQTDSQRNQVRAGGRRRLGPQSKPRSAWCAPRAPRSPPTKSR